MAVKRFRLYAPRGGAGARGGTKAFPAPGRGVSDHRKKPCPEGRAAIVAGPAFKDFAIGFLKNILRVSGIGGTTTQGPPVTHGVVLLEEIAQLRFAHGLERGFIVIFIHKLGGSDIGLI